MRILLMAMSLLLYTAIEANAQISVGIQTHGVSIGFNVSSYPRLVAIPGYPVYYDPRANSNYFFYDGLYWVYQDDNWYSSAWYDGPWDLIAPEDVPLFVLRVPVRYYRHRPTYFSGWSLSLAPRWGEHWGHDWEQRRSGWDQWDRHSVPRAAPLPTYQRQYYGSRYPRAVEQQYSIQSKSYNYRPREAITQQILQQRAVPSSTRNEPPQQVQSPQQKVQSPQQTRTEERAQAQQQSRAKDQAQAQVQQRAQQQQRPRTENKAQAQQQKHAQDQAQSQAQVQQQQRTQQQQQRTEDKAQAQQQQQQKRAQDQAQAQQQQKRAQNQAQTQQQSRAKDQVQAQQKAQQQQPQRGQQQAPAPKAQSNKQEQKKEKEDKKDGGGPEGH